MTHHSSPRFQKPWTFLCVIPLKLFPAANRLRTKACLRSCARPRGCLSCSLLSPKTAVGLTSTYVQMVLVGVVVDVNVAIFCLHKK